MTDPYELVQPIVIDRTATHEDAVISAALASVHSHHTSPDLDCWEQWLAGPIAKTVRRAKPSDWDRTMNVLPLLGNGLFVVTEATSTGRAFALAPMTYDDMPAAVRRCQVSGTDLTRTGTWPSTDPDGFTDYPVLSINAAALMSTGKTAAQVSHALFSWYIQLEPFDRVCWVHAGSPMVVEDLAAPFFAVARAVADVVIEDAGRTEIAPGTTTVVVNTRIVKEAAAHG